MNCSVFLNLHKIHKVVNITYLYHLAYTYYIFQDMQNREAPEPTQELSHLSQVRDEVEEWIPLKQRKSAQKVNKNRWTTKENKLYVQFLKKNLDKFRDKQSRKKGKVFLRLAKQIKKRTYEQVKSHHQKMIIKYHGIETIIREFEATFILQMEMQEPLSLEQRCQWKQAQISPQVEPLSLILDTSNVPQLTVNNKNSIATQDDQDSEMRNEFLQWFSDI